MSTRWSEFLAGARAELPILIGVVPFGMIYGVLAVSSGLSTAAGQAMSAIVFAGSAQFINTQLLQSGVPAVVILLTTLVVNLRHALYSASIAPYIQKLNPLWKAGLAYLLTDEAYAIAILHYQQAGTAQELMKEENPPPRHLYFLGAGLALWTSWQISTAAGIFLGAQVPASWSLDFTLALTFIALVMPALKDRPGLASALSAGVTAVLANGLPYKLGLVVAALVGILAGVLMERRS